jgi:hypothetical protein
MAEKDVSSLARSERNRALEGRPRKALGELDVGEAGVSERGEDCRHIQVRTNENPCGPVAPSDIGEQEEHQERATPRLHIYAPRAILARKAGVGMPAGVARIVRGREADGKGAEAGAREPASGSHQKVEGFVESRGVRGLAERFLRIVAETDYRAGPGGRAITITAGIAPQDGATFGREICGKAPGRCMKPARTKSSANIS